MMQIVVIEEGGVKCSSACPFYEEGGVVKCYGGPKRSHCRAIMEPWSFDCNKFNPKRMWKLKATEAQFKAMVKSQGLHAIRQKKLLPYDHQPSLQIGESGRTKGRLCPKAEKMNRQQSNHSIKKGDHYEKTKNDED